jgi:hypothetical protein
MHPSFHDGFVQGLFSSDSEVKLFLCTVAGEKFTLLLQGVERLHVENFRQGNIVFEVAFLTMREFQASDIRDLYEMSNESMRTFDLGKWAEHAEQKGLKGIQVSSSYGCSIRGLFRSHELLSGHLV